MSTYIIIIYIVFTFIFIGMKISSYEEEELSKLEIVLIVIFGWILAPIYILIVFGKLISFLNKCYG